ncbi:MULTISPECIES: type II toxin-antitoxin system RelE/ParE family toxin [unclassified Modicisalibacter]|uniref:type II toxin-antitoxin system RelE/ParE family toxin n=1 Tax=unclassified Modicisalibacter TaxID=2679913 RepID=UPI001CCA272D|nr:type II toxin-antitoxin system RelE/ParE family toxin [Modicisalibacter sp. R2A 31.J]MBZ9573699.1 type II toxin-antitoxin system RelE/ParE family toxin [Modicisalibacter sp. MOD 31.J]
MSTAVVVSFETTAEASLEACEHFLIDQLDMPLEQAQALSLRLLTTTMERLSQRPGTYPVCRLALEMGISHYRELLIDGYRVIYRYRPDENQVAVHLFAHQRQDFKQLLFEYQLLY